MTQRIIFGIGDELLKKEGLTHTIQPWEDGLRADTRPASFEWWYFDAHLDDGTSLVTTFYTKPFVNRRSPLKPGLLLTLIRKDGTRKSNYLESPPSDFSASTKTCDVRIGRNHASGDLHRYELHLETLEVLGELTFTGEVPAWRPGSGINYYDKALTRYFAWLPAIPFGKVKGCLTYDGQNHQVEGVGYHDHNWGNTSVQEVLHHWYWGRLHLGEYSAIFVEMNALPKFDRQKIPVFMIAKGDHIFEDIQATLKLQTMDFVRHPAGWEYPRSLDFDWHSGKNHARIELRNPSIIEATSLLTYLPNWQQKLARLFVNPYYLRFDAEVRLSVELDGKQDQKSGHAIYELMMLR